MSTLLYCSKIATNYRIHYYFTHPPHILLDSSVPSCYAHTHTKHYSVTLHSILQIHKFAFNFKTWSATTYPNVYSGTTLSRKRYSSRARRNTTQVFCPRNLLILLGFRTLVGRHFRPLQPGWCLPYCSHVG